MSVIYVRFEILYSQNTIFFSMINHTEFSEKMNSVKNP